jgi:Rps23 Pro-64 3,4-dihydroxylase Tpa1-like proline 4-hydroxylase
MELNADPETLSHRYRTAAPFPHIVLDDVFPAAELEKVLGEFPAPQQTEWVRFDNPTEKKLGFHHHKSAISETIRQFLWRMNSFEVLEFLENLTGIAGLIPDPYFGGGGIHQIERGGFLKVHADFNWHPKLRLDRRLNMLIYLNKDWREEYGGHLELWDGETNQCVRSILPVFNRTVIFSTTDKSYHGHPKPLNCPPEMTRKSLSLYYYTNGRPEEERSAPHDTIFLKRDESDW